MEDGADESIVSQPHGCIYKIEHGPTGRCYIGQTRQTPSRRWTAHRRNARIGEEGPLYDAMRTFPLAEFSFSVVEDSLSIGRRLTAEERVLVKRICGSAKLETTDCAVLEELSQELDGYAKVYVRRLFRESGSLDAHWKAWGARCFKGESPLNDAERRWIRKEESFYPKGFNVTPGGKQNKKACKRYRARRLKIEQAFHCTS